MRTQRPLVERTQSSGDERPLALIRHGGQPIRLEELGRAAAPNVSAMSESQREPEARHLGAGGHEGSGGRPYEADTRVLQHL